MKNRLSPSPMIRVDFHCHSSSSPDSLSSPAEIIRACRKKGIDKVAITDHNTLEGAIQAKQVAPELIIVGEEIMTTKGELLAFFVKETVPAGLEPLQAIARLREQQAFISVSHPFDNFRKGHWETADLLQILPEIDAVETFNARCFLPSSNWKADAFRRKNQILATHGSDAHTTGEIGNGSLLLPPFDDRMSLMLALQTAVSPRLVLSPPWVHLFSRYASWKKRQTRS